MRNIYKTCGFSKRHLEATTILVVKVGNDLQVMNRGEFDSLIEDRTQPGFSKLVYEELRKISVFASVEDAQKYIWNAASADVYPGTAIYPATNSGYDYNARNEPNVVEKSIQ
jgi:hypothetical protein